jgi:hypothetical protein
MSETKEGKLAGKGVFIALGIICIVLVAGLTVSIVAYTSIIRDRDNTISSLNSKVTSLQTQVNQFLNENDFILKDFILFNDEFGNVSVVIPSYDFSPPVSIYRALQIALESGRWNASSLSKMTVSVSLEYWEFWSNSSINGSEFLHDVTQPARDYSPVQVNSTTYRYIWYIVVDNNVGLQIPPPGFYWVDAATGEIVPPGTLR